MSRESFQAPGDRDRAAGRGVERLSCSRFPARPRLVVRFRLDVYKTRPVMPFATFSLGGTWGPTVWLRDLRPHRVTGPSWGRGSNTARGLGA